MIQQFLGRGFLQEVVQGDARAHRVDADAMFGRLHRGTAGQGHHPRLGGGVVALLLLCAPAEHRGVVDDHPVPALDHLRQHGAGHAHGAGEGHVQYAVPLLVAHFHQQARAAEAGVVDQYVDAAQVAFGGGDQRLHLLLAGDVADLRVDLLQAGGLADLLRRFLQPALVNVADHQRPAALFGGAQGGGETNAGAGGGGDQHRLAAQQAVAGNVGGNTAHASSSTQARTRGSRGMPSARSAMMLRWISLVPP
ncbi:hypothetical protein D9M68_661910 [compost metagenome]